MKKSFYMVSKNPEAGEALVAVMVAATIGIILVMGLVSSIAYMSTQVKSTELDVARDDLAKQIRLILSSTDTCSRLLQNADLSAAVAAPLPALPADFNADLGTNLRVNASGPVQISGADFTLTDPTGGPIPLPQTNGLGISRLRVQLVSNVVPTVYSAGFGAGDRLVSGRLYVGITKTNASALGATSPPASIPITIMMAGNSLRYCATDTDEGVLCRSLGNTWIPFEGVTPDNKRCVAPMECKKGGSYAEGPDAQGGFDNPITGGKSCAPPFVAQRAGTITYTQANGKTKVTNIFHNVYDCMACQTAEGYILPLTANALPAGTPVDLDFDDEYSDGEGNFVNYDQQIRDLYTRYAQQAQPTPYPTPAPTPIPPAPSCSEAIAAWVSKCGGAVTCETYAATQYSPYSVVVSQLCGRGSWYSVNGSAPAFQADDRYDTR